MSNYFTAISLFKKFSSYNLKWESIMKTNIYEERKSNAFNSDRVFF